MKKLLGGMALVAALSVATAGSASAATPVPGFKEETLATGLNAAVSMDWTPDGRMVIAEKPGFVKVRNTDGSVVRVMDLSARVNDAGDRGLTGIAVDPQYASNNFVYLLYTYDGAGRDGTGPTSSRLTRIVLGTNNKVANVNTAPETTILGTWPTLAACPPDNQVADCIPADGISHVVGSVRFAPDGTLFVGTGDAMYNATNKPDPMRPLNEHSLAGKILHIDRNGRGLPGHRFCPTFGNLNHPCTKVYAMGFRNPFRFSVASRGGLWAGDVGEALWEELDHVGAGGSYGWPCWENNVRNRAFEYAPRCVAAYGAGDQTFPVWAYEHGPNGAAVIGGPEIRSSKFPADWQGQVIVGDIVGGDINRLEVDSLGNLLAVRPFATGWLGADLRMGPDGNLYSAEFSRIRRFVPAAGNRPPEARATVKPNAGLVPFNAQFDGTGSTDPDGDALTYQWTFGDGMSSTEAAPVHTYLSNDRYTAKLTVTDVHGASSSAEVVVVVGTTPPEVTFTAPGASFLYSNGTPVDMAVTAVDAEDGTLPEASIAWQVLLQHNQHQHFLGTFTGRTAQFTPLTSHDADSHYIVEVTATDSAGVSTTVTRRLDPKTVRLELTTDPPLPVELFYDGAPRTAPYVKQAAVGFETTIVAPNTVTDGQGRTLVFSGWSNGGAANHAITVPAHDLTLAAIYREDTTPPDTFITAGPGYANNSKEPQFTFHSSEVDSKFQCKVDSGGWVPCSSPYRIAPQKVGSHTFYVRAIDLGGNVDPTPAEKGFAVVRVPGN